MAHLTNTAHLTNILPTPPADLRALTTREFVAYRDTLTRAATRLTDAEAVRREAFTRLLDADRLLWSGPAAPVTTDADARHTLTEAGDAALREAEQAGNYPGDDYDHEPYTPQAVAMTEEEQDAAFERAVELGNFFGLDAEGGRS